MNSRTLILLALLLLALVPTGRLSAEEPSGSDELEQALQHIDDGVDKLRALAERLKSASDQENDALSFRLDQRGIRLVADVTDLVHKLSNLPEDDPERVKIMQRLRQELAGLDSAMFERIAGLEQRIRANNSRETGRNQAEIYALAAYGQGLEGLRLGYSGALVHFIESMQALGENTDALQDRTRKLLYQQAERLAGRIDLLAAMLKQINSRLSTDSSNADLQSAANETRLAHNLETGRLDALLKLMSRLQMDTVLYRSVLLRETSGVSLRMFDLEALKKMLEDGWASSREALASRAPDFLLKLLVFALILFGFRALARLVKRVVKSTLNRSSANLSTLLKEILVSASGALVMILGLLVALAQVGISLGPALAGLGVAGFIVGFALQDTLGNFAAGAMILLYRPYDVDDFVEVAGASGLVKKMTLVSTTITTFDNQTLVIPNNKIWGDVIKNVTAQQIRRVDLEFNIGYGEDIDKAERVLGDILESHDKVLDTPAPTIRLHRLGEYSMNFIVRPWAATADYWQVYWDLTREVKRRFDREGITIPYPQRDVHLHQDKT